ncbi:MAG: prepilin-type N-terminal cleavage/methylation domain-containing protein [bacterium]|nr:prepilin-type N-terminal cleavage/methylation domain-containing protein [bacterium]
MNKTKGFTLIETMLYVSLLSFMLVNSLTTTHSFLEITNKLQQKMNIEKEGTYALQRIEQDIRNNKIITRPFISSTIPISNFLIKNEIIANKFKKVIVRFNIERHEFSVTHIIPYE